MANPRGFALCRRPPGAVTFKFVDVVRIVQFFGIADNVEMVATVEIDAANVYWHCTFCSEQPCFSNYFSISCRVFDDFGCHGATSAALGAPLGALGAPKVDFGAIRGVIWEPFGVLGRLYGAVSEPWMEICGVFFAKFILDGILVAKCCQNCLKKGCPARHNVAKP